MKKFLTYLAVVLIPYLLLTTVGVKFLYTFHKGLKAQKSSIESLYLRIEQSGDDLTLSGPTRVGIGQGGTATTTAQSNALWFQSSVASGTPGYFTQDSNLTYATTTDTLTIVNASTTQLTTTGSTYLATTGGNVGIGTTSPGTLLSLGNTGANTINISATATSTFGSGINVLTGCFAVNGTCVGGGSGITSLGALGQAQTGTAQTFATSSDTNIGLTITSTGDVHTFTSNWIGTLANSRLTNSTISGVALGGTLANLTATDGTLTFSGTYTGATARTIGLNLANANTWTGLQTFGNASSTLFSTSYASSTTADLGVLTVGVSIALPDNSVAEADINFATSCATGNHLYISGGNLACEADDDVPEAADYSNLTAGRSLTAPSVGTLDADAELYTYEIWSGSFGSSTMSTTTGTFLQKIVANASTITGVWCSTNKGTSTIMLEERSSATPNTAGTDIGNGGFSCGSGVNQAASSTVANPSLDANDIINFEITDAEPTGNKPTIIYWHIIGTKND